MKAIAMITSCTLGSCISAELLGYWLHRFLHSGTVPFLSRNHMKHHMLLYGPLQKQRSHEYHDATSSSVSLGNIGMEWLVPAALLIAFMTGVFRLFRVPFLYVCVYFVTTLLWSFLMFSYLHDVMHVEDSWLERNRWLRRWFLAARRRHDVHHCVLNDNGLMDKNFGIACFFFDRIFGTLSDGAAVFNAKGYRTARERFQSVLGGN